MPGGPVESAAWRPAAGSPAESPTWRWQGERAALLTVAGLQLPSLSPLPPPPRCHPSARGLLLSQRHRSGKPLNGKIFPNCSLLNFFFLASLKHSLFCWVFFLNSTQLPAPLRSKTMSPASNVGPLCNALLESRPLLLLGFLKFITLKTQCTFFLSCCRRDA